MRCPRCEKQKSIDDFYYNKKTGRYAGYCRSCQYKATRASTADGYQRAYTQRRVYGMEPGEYNELLAKQGGKCAICGCEEYIVGRGGEVKPLAVDHDHNTGKVRGLLCQNCNVGLGYFWDNPTWLLNAVRYLGLVAEDGNVATPNRDAATVRSRWQETFPGAPLANGTVYEWLHKVSVERVLEAVDVADKRAKYRAGPSVAKYVTMVIQSFVNNPRPSQSASVTNPQPASFGGKDSITDKDRARWKAIDDYIAEHGSPWPDWGNEDE